MNVDMSRMHVRVRLSGVLDASGAMQLLNELDRFRTGEGIVDFSAIRDVEPSGGGGAPRAPGGGGAHAVIVEGRRWAGRVEAWAGSSSRVAKAAACFR